ncbi:UNVERIFIED_CONTAM: hypothetical protein FKN15_025746 [Acipenser sinensis]
MHAILSSSAQCAPLARPFLEHGVLQVPEGPPRSLESKAAECDCVHGICSSGIGGNGSCICETGYTGVRCDQESQLCHGMDCGENSVCNEGAGGTAVCGCMPGFQKTGQQCLPQDPCAQNVCDHNADCVNHGQRKYDCRCKEAYQGDGKVCVPVNPCLIDNGGCPTNSTNCVYKSVGKSFSFQRDQSKTYRILQSDLAAANGIIHIINQPVTNISPEHEENEQDSKKTIEEIIANQLKFSRYQTLLENCEMSPILEGPGPFTVFVPTNEAVDRHRDGTIIYLLTDGKKKLQELVKHHIYTSASITVDRLAAMPQILTKANQIITVNVTSDGRIVLGDKAVVLNQQDIVASNGIIHVIDGILIPPSIVPILPHRCDVTEYNIVMGQCVDCSELDTTSCPLGSTELDKFHKGCEYISSVMNIITNRRGCAKYCNKTVVRPDCCKGFYGPDCKACLGGFQTPCYQHGTCNDGIQGNGTCSCLPDFQGIACHICSNPNKHGEMCDEGRPGSKGVCRINSCAEGYTGELCDRVTKPCGPSGLSQYCHINAVCDYSDDTRCVCRNGYEGDGFSCREMNPCQKADRGGCSANARCIYTSPGNATCICNEGWAGDGQACVEIDNCLLNNRGGCHYNADCITQGPGQSECVCKKNYMGDGYNCDIINPCLQSNGGCHSLTVMIQNASILISDIPAVNGFINVIDQVLIPSLADIPPPPPGLMQVLNQTTSFSLFKKALLHYNLTEKIDSSEKYTILIPFNKAVEDHLNATRSEELDEDSVRYHIIVEERLQPGNLRNGIHKSTMLGSSYQIMFHNNNENQTYANEVPLNGVFYSTRNGMLMGISQLLHIHKNRCDKNVTVLTKLTHVADMAALKSNCKYRKKNKRLNGCSYQCLTVTEDHNCCPGYFGLNCFKCPGKPGNWCSNNGICQDGVLGSGDCLCKEGFHGTACEDCEPGRHGTSCESEINPCDIGNGGCSEHANCTKISPGERSCTCTEGYFGDGVVCIEKDGCLIDHGGCHRLAECIKTGPNLELDREPAASWFNKKAQIEEWKNKSLTGHMVRYHVVGCQTLLLSDIQSLNTLVTLTGSSLQISVEEDTVYLNKEVKIVSSDFVTSNGVIHFIDKVLVPSDLQNKSDLHQPKKNVTETAESHGYTIFSKLLQDAGLLSMVQNSLHHPFTMLWPTDKVFNSLPDERKKWLYSEDHRDKLAAYIKAHIIRDNKIVAADLPNQKSLRTLYGSLISFACSRNITGDIFVDDGNAKIVDRQIEFDVGIAYGIDQLLEPPNMGARCDDFVTTTVSRVSPCSHPYYYTSGLFHSPFGYRRRYHHLMNPFHHQLSVGCMKECNSTQWVAKCCKNHYGRDCQVCPGGLEAPCSNHGACNDGMAEQGKCNCTLGFTGTTCGQCAPNRYGPDCRECSCTVHGKCAEGIDGDGSCFCKEGWIGENCELQLGVKPVCTPECDANAVCQPNNICECDSLYEGDGRNCTVVDLCMDFNGGCHEHATCTQNGVNRTCTCLPVYTGDGYSCTAINRCVSDNGGCSEFATCIFTGPNERRCECNEGFVGNGVQCLEKAIPPLDRCLEENGGCHPQAICTDLHFEEKTAGVFHVQSPKGKYKLTYSDAQAACQAERATMATIAQLSAAQQFGYHSCAAGWLDSENVGYPTTNPSLNCGNNHVGVVLYNKPGSLYDAYCYRIKDVSCVCRDGYVGDGDFCNGNLLDVVASSANFSVFYSTLLEYANYSSRGVELVDFLSNETTYETLFVPADAGFGENETLSLRDLEYHISVNDSFIFYDEMSHGTVIPSRLGYNLSVTVSSFKRWKLTSGSKLVNDHLIVEWDIPASNGILHIIERPLKAPPPPVLSAVAPASPHSSAAVVSTVLVVCLLAVVAGGVLYFCFKPKNEGFHFRYFKADEDEDDGMPSPAEGRSSLVSVPNPLFSGYNAFTEPFDVAVYSRGNATLPVQSQVKTGDFAQPGCEPAP